MAISAAGIGSGLDINSIVSQLVAAERAPEATRIANATGRYTTQLSALGSLTSALATLKDKVKTLASGTDLSGFKASSSLSDIFTATASSSAAAGSYQVEVVSLAKANRLTSDPYVDGASTVIGSGDVQISVGGNAFTVSLTDSGSTLGDLRDAINAASDNTGVSATLVNETNGTRLLLTANEPGSASQVTVNSTLLSFTEQQAATDAHIRVEGYDIYSSSNTISDAVDGVTFKLLDESPGSVGTLTISRDNSKAQSAVQSFVAAYNAVVSAVKSVSGYDAESKTAQPLTGDAAVRGAMATLRRIAGGVVNGAGDYTTLASLGITTAKDGTLSINSPTLSDALSADPAAVSKLFSGDNGIGTQLASALDGLIGSDGSLTFKKDSINSQIKRLGDQTDALNRRIDSYQTHLQAQYSRLDALIAQMNSLSSSLAQQLSSLPKIG